MEKFLEALSEKGIDASSMDDAERRKVAKAVGLDPSDYLPRSVEIVEHTNQRDETNTFVKTDPYKVTGTKKDGTSKTVRGLFQRVETLDQMISDLLAAKELLAADSDES